MSTINSISSQSSIDQLIELTMQTERKPITEIESQKSDLSKKLNIFTDLKGYLSALNDRVDGMTDKTASPLTSKRTAVSSNESIFTAEADKTAATGIHSIFVNHLASRDIGVSKRISDPENSTAIAGRFNGTTQTFSLAIGSGEAVEISIEFTDPAETDAAAMKRIRDAINNSGLKVSAGYTMDTPTSARLTMTGIEAGAENAISVQDVGDGELMRLAGFIGADGDRIQYEKGTEGGFLKSDIEDLNARFELDGIAIVRGSNVITDVLEGVTLQLKRVQNDGDAAETLTIDRDTEAIKESINSFVEDFNNVLKYINNKTSINTVTYERGPLSGDFQLMNLRLQLRDTVTRSVAGLEPGLFNSLPEIGISLSREGLMSIKDEDAFNEALEANPARVSELFSSVQGIASKMEPMLDRYVNSGGVVDNNKKGVNNKIDYLNNQIKSYEARLVIREQTLRQEYASLQQALSQLQNQQSMITNFSNLAYQYGF